MTEVERDALGQLAHGAHLQTDEQEVMEMLATASLLMRALDRAEKRIPPKPAQ